MNPIVMREYPALERFLWPTKRLLNKHALVVSGDKYIGNTCSSAVRHTQLKQDAGMPVYMAQALFRIFGF